MSPKNTKFQMGDSVLFGLLAFIIIAWLFLEKCN